tara:strand:- start:1371 stop:2030 length:660 start_codon:yes stop_codon:yes gene_type:complete
LKILLNKKSLREIIINHISENDLGFIFSKYNDRIYYFQREPQSVEAFDTMKIKVHFKKGKIYCTLHSIVNKSLKNNLYVYNGLLNRQLRLENSFIDSTTFPKNICYRFENTEESLIQTMSRILYDLNTKGKNFIEESDERFYDSKYKKAMEFINNLNLDKLKLKEQFYKDSAFANNSIPKNSNPTFRKLVSELNDINKGEFPVENHMIAFEFLHKYMNE